MVAVRYTMHDIHKEEVLGIPPSGKEIAVATMSFSRIQNGKFMETWVATDIFSMMYQLGAAPAHQ